MGSTQRWASPRRAGRAPVARRSEPQLHGLSPSCTKELPRNDLAAPLRGKHEPQLRESVEDVSPSCTGGANSAPVAQPGERLIT